jgi:ubiquinone/menaquinone biosynthesis C-methylase UbiE/protein-S-isoprenylcysteine O-methyltransferase Ste14
MNWKALKKNAVTITAVSFTSDLSMVGLYLLDKGNKIPSVVKKTVNIAGVAGVNTAWIIAPLTDQQRLCRTWGRPARVLGGALIALGAYIGWSSTKDRRVIGIETPDALVTRGMYGYMRHPTYAAIMASSLGWSLSAGAPYSAAALLPLAAGLIAAGVYEESTQLKPIFGEEYEAYRGNTPFIPRSLAVPLAAVYLLALGTLKRGFLEDGSVMSQGQTEQESMHFRTRALDRSPGSYGFLLKLAGRTEGRFRHRCIELASLEGDERVLDAGCGTGALAIELAGSLPGLRIHGCDISPKMISVAGGKAEEAGLEIDYETGRITELPYPEGFFDAVFTNIMFHHLDLDEKRKAVSEVYRVLKPGGVYVSAEFGPEAKGRIRQHVREHIMKGKWTIYPEHLAEVGFDVERESIEKSIWSLPVAFRLCRKPYDNTGQAPRLFQRIPKKTRTPGES